KRRIGQLSRRAKTVTCPPPWEKITAVRNATPTTGSQTTIVLDLKFLHTVPEPSVGMLSGRRNSLTYVESFSYCGRSCLRHTGRHQCGGDAGGFPALAQRNHQNPVDRSS